MVASSPVASSIDWTVASSPVCGGVGDARRAVRSYKKLQRILGNVRWCWEEEATENILFYRSALRALFCRSPSELSKHVFCTPYQGFKGPQDKGSVRVALRGQGAHVKHLCCTLVQDMVQLLFLCCVYGLAGPFLSFCTVHQVYPCFNSSISQFFIDRKSVV